MVGMDDGDDGGDGWWGWMVGTGLVQIHHLCPFF